MMHQIAETIAALSGWRRVVVAVLAGITTAAALPPVYALPALWIGVPVFVWLLRGAVTRRRAALDGWCFGWGYFFAGLHWISYSLLVDGDKFAWMIPFALILIPAILGIYIAAVAVLTRVVSDDRLHLVVLALSWALMEWLRSQLFTGFSWNPIAAVWAFDPAPIQMLAYLGLYGVGFVTVLIAAAPAVLIARSGSIRYVPVIVAIAAVGLIWLGGLARLSTGPSETVPNVVLRLVQPNIPQHLKWKKDLRDRHLATYLRLSRIPGDLKPTHLVWPETAVPFVVSRDHQVRQVMATVIPNGGLLLTGALRSSPRGEKPFRLWNSFHAIAPGGRITATSDKFHLVPFGEYVPLRRWVGFAKITSGRTDFTAGPGPQTLDLLGLPPVSPLICYEIIFPDRLVDPDNRPGWLLNVTNDAWFGDSAGPYQHFALSRMRAVEQGLPVVRAANTGISGVIDANGRVTARLGLGKQGVIDARLPRALPPTFYSQAGDLPYLMILICALLGCFFARKF